MYPSTPLLAFGAIVHERYLVISLRRRAGPFTSISFSLNNQRHWFKLNRHRPAGCQMIELKKIEREWQGKLMNYQINNQLRENGKSVGKLWKCMICYVYFFLLFNAKYLTTPWKPEWMPTRHNTTYSVFQICERSRRLHVHSVPFHISYWVLQSFAEFFTTSTFLCVFVSPIPLAGKKQFLRCLSSATAYNGNILVYQLLRR